MSTVRANENLKALRIKREIDEKTQVDALHLGGDYQIEWWATMPKNLSFNAHAETKERWLGHEVGPKTPAHIWGCLIFHLWW